MATAGLERPDVLDLCDRILGEPGRRLHLFAWLREPGAGAEDWLPVDAYYPAHRLVVVWRQDDAARDPTYSELVPAHGLRLLELSPDELVGDPAAALSQRIAGLGAAVAPPPRERTTTPVQDRQTDEKSQIGYGFGLSVGLGVVLFIELYLGVARGALDHGHIVLAFALALDACARAVGTIAARRAGRPDWAWGCVLIGSPAVAIFSRSEDATAEPAPLAGLLAVVALLALVVAVLTG